MFVLLTEATTGEYILLRKSLIDRAYPDVHIVNGKQTTVTRIDFVDNKPTEWVEESVTDIYKKLL